MWALCTLSEVRRGDLLSIGFAENRFLKDAAEVSWVKKPQELSHFLGKRGAGSKLQFERRCAGRKGVHTTKVASAYATLLGESTSFSEAAQAHPGNMGREKRRCAFGSREAQREG